MYEYNLMDNVFPLWTIHAMHIIFIRTINEFMFLGITKTIQVWSNNYLWCSGFQRTLKWRNMVYNCIIWIANKSFLNAFASQRWKSNLLDINSLLRTSQVLLAYHLYNMYFFQLIKVDLILPLRVIKKWKQVS